MIEQHACNEDRDFAIMLGRHLRRLVRTRATLAFVLAFVASIMVLGSVLPSLAGAVTNSTPATPAEAPWMVKLLLYFPDGSGVECTGEIIAPGAVATAGHCVSQQRCQATIQPDRITMRFSNGQLLQVVNPSVSLEPGYRCYSNRTSPDDLAVIHFTDPWGLPAIPIGSAAQIASFANRGVTAFGGGQYQKINGRWYSSSWVRKSANGGLTLNPYCQIPQQLCFRFTGSTVRPGDSGGALVGWVGHWVLLAVLDDNFQLTFPNLALGSGMSMGDLTVSAWVHSQITSVPPPPPPPHEFAVMHASGGIYWRSGPDWNTAERIAGNGFYPGTIIAVTCYQSGAANVPGSRNSMWEQGTWVSGPGSGHGWINEHFINDGSAINQPSLGVPPCGSSGGGGSGGGSWTGPLAVPTNGPVSCVSSTFCMDAGGGVTRFDGTSWGQLVNILGQGPANSASAVSCVSPSFCDAMGFNSSAVYSGTSWSPPTGPGGSSVSCVSPTFCVALVAAGVVTYDGLSWSAPVNVGTGLFSVSCGSMTLCAAVDGSGHAFIYNGVSWSGPTTIGTGPTPFVSCTGTNFCAVASDKKVVTFYSGSWGAPTATNVIAFPEISCTSAVFCMVVGMDATGLQGTAITYNGASWSAPTAFAGTGELWVSCVSPSFCMAVQRTGTGSGNAYVYGP